MPTFDVVSEVDMQEVRNAVDQANREATTRFDFKGTDSAIELNDKELLLTSSTEDRLRALYQVLQEKLVKREVTQILSPGTHFDERMLVAERNNFLGAVYPVGRRFGLAFVDLTTGDFVTTEVESDAEMLTELQRLRPAELIYPAESGAVRDRLQGGIPTVGQRVSPAPLSSACA